MNSVLIENIKRNEEMIIKKDLRIEKTEKAIKDAFLSLLDLIPYSKITVADITRKAIVNRNTFYLHYIDKEDLLNKIMLEKLEYSIKQVDDLVKKYNFSKKLAMVKEVKNLTKDALTIIEKEKAFFSILVKEPLLSGYFNKLKYYIKNYINFGIQRKKESIISFEYFYNGVIGVFEEWLRSDFANIDELSETLSSIITSNVRMIYKSITK